MNKSKPKQNTQPELTKGYKLYDYNPYREEPVKQSFRKITLSPNGAVYLHSNECIAPSLKSATEILFGNVKGNEPTSYSTSY